MTEVNNDELDLSGAGSGTCITVRGFGVFELLDGLFDICVGIKLS